MALVAVMEAANAFCKLVESGVNAQDRTRAEAPKIVIRYFFILIVTPLFPPGEKPFPETARFWKSPGFNYLYCTPAVNVSGENPTISQARCLPHWLLINNIPNIDDNQMKFSELVPEIELGSSHLSADWMD